MAKYEVWAQGDCVRLVIEASSEFEAGIMACREYREAMSVAEIAVNTGEHTDGWRLMRLRNNVPARIRYAQQGIADLMRAERDQDRLAVLEAAYHALSFAEAVVGGQEEWQEEAELLRAILPEDSSHD